MKLWLPHCLNSWSVIVVRPRHADAVLSCSALVVRARWKLWKKSYGMPKQHARHWTQSVSLWWAYKYSTFQNAPERGFFTRKEKQLHLHPHIIGSTHLPIAHLPTFQVINQKSHLLTFGYSSNVLTSSLYLHLCFYLVQRKPSNSWNDCRRKLIRFRCLFCMQLWWRLWWTGPFQRSLFWRCVVKVEVFQPHRQPRPAGLLLGLLRQKLHMFLPFEVRGLRSAEPQALRTIVSCVMLWALGETWCCNGGWRLSTGSDDSTATGATSLPPLDLERNEAASGAPFLESLLLNTLT